MLWADKELSREHQPSFCSGTFFYFFSDFIDTKIETGFDAFQELHRQIQLRGTLKAALPRMARVNFSNNSFVDTMERTETMNYNFVLIRVATMS